MEALSEGEYRFYFSSVNFFSIKVKPISNKTAIIIAGIAPLSTFDIFKLVNPSYINSPKPPAPTNEVIIATLFAMTAANLTPAKIAG